MNSKYTKHDPYLPPVSSQLLDIPDVPIRSEEEAEQYTSKYLTPIMDYIEDRIRSYLPKEAPYRLEDVFFPLSANMEIDARTQIIPSSITYIITFVEDVTQPLSGPVSAPDPQGED